MANVGGPHGIVEHASGQRRLNPSDRSRYQSVRLAVTRDRSGRGTVSVVVRDVRGGILRDTRLLTGSIDLSPGSLASADPRVALREALELLAPSVASDPTA